MPDTPFKVGDDVHFEHWNSPSASGSEPWFVSGTITAIEPHGRFSKNPIVVVNDFYRLDGFGRLRRGFERDARR